MSASSFEGLFQLGDIDGEYKGPIFARQAHPAGPENPVQSAPEDLDPPEQAVVQKGFSFSGDGVQQKGGGSGYERCADEGEEGSLSTVAYKHVDSWCKKFCW